MKSKKLFIAWGMLALTFTLVLAGCGGKGSGGGGGREAPASDFKYDLNETGDGVIIQEYLGKPGGRVVIPAKIEDYPVMGIGGFGERTTGAMENARKRNPDDKAVGSNGRTARISSVVIPGTVTHISDEAFRNCEDLKEITLPKSLKSIGMGAFWGTGLTSITIPEGVTALGEFDGSNAGSVFFGCENLTSVTLPESLEEIWDSTFASCPELTTVNLPSHPIKYITHCDPDYGRRNRPVVRKLTGSGQVVVEDDATNGTFKGCPKLSLAARKAIQDSGYKGSF
jgi:hypothetical protein